MMPYYPAVVSKDPTSDYGVHFPDVLGCVSAGETLDDALEGAREALSGHLALMAEEGLPIPAPSSLEAVVADPENQGSAVVLVYVPASTSFKRVNITLPEDALREIDAYAEAHGLTRSGFLASAARKAMKDRAA